MSKSTAFEGIARVDAFLRERLEAGLEAAADFLVQKIREEHAFQNRTGETERSIQGGIHQVTREGILAVITAGGAAKHLEFSGKGSNSVSTPADALAEAARRGDWAFLAPAIERHMHEILPIIERHAKF